MERKIQSKAEFLYYQGKQLTDEYNQLCWDDVILKDGSILRFDEKGYLHGMVECGNGLVQFFEHGLLHGSPAVISQDLRYFENWENGQIKKIVSGGKEYNF